MCIIAVHALQFGLLGMQLLFRFCAYCCSLLETDGCMTLLRAFSTDLALGLISNSHYLANGFHVCLVVDTMGYCVNACFSGLTIYIGDENICSAALAIINLIW